jgi:hypothetical protein
MDYVLTEKQVKKIDGFFKGGPFDGRLIKGIPTEVISTEGIKVDIDTDGKKSVHYYAYIGRQKSGFHEFVSIQDIRVMLSLLDRINAKS